MEFSKYEVVGMKSKILIILLSTFFSVVKADNISSHVIVVTTQCGTNVQLQEEEQREKVFFRSEKYFRRGLYWMEKYNPLFFKLHKVRKDIDYYIAILTEHIKLLENKIMLRQNGLHSNAMFVGILISLFSTLLACTSYKTFQDSRGLDLDKSQEGMIGAVILGVTSTVFALVAGNEFYKVYRYAERLIGRLERDTRILAILEREKAALVSGSLPLPARPEPVEG